MKSLILFFLIATNSFASTSALKICKNESSAITATSQVISKLSRNIVEETRFWSQAEVEQKFAFAGFAQYSSETGLKLRDVCTMSQFELKSIANEVCKKSWSDRSYIADCQLYMSDDIDTL